MKITFIRFSIFERKYNTSFKPLVFQIISALTPKDIQLEFVDEHVEDLPEKIDCDVIALSVETLTARKARDFALKHKTKNNVIVVGGFHPSVMPEECLEYADAVTIGDAEDTWPQILEDIKSGNLKKIYKSSLEVPPAKPDLHLAYFKDKKYSPIGLAQFSRGCKFNCDFCSIKAMYPGKVRTKNIDDFIEEIKSMPEKIIFLADDNLFIDEQTTLHLLEKLKPLKKMWHCQISMDVAYNDKILTAMKEAGFVMVMIGFEAINPETLKQMNKGANMRIKNYEEAINNIYKHGLMITAGFISGYDNDTIDTIWEHFNFAMKHHFTKAFFTMLQPMPGTRLYKRLLAEGRMSPDKWWLDKNYKYGDCVFEPKNMTKHELEREFYAAWKAYYSFGNIWKRFKANFKYLSFVNSLLFLGEALLQKKNLNLNVKK